MGFFYAIALRTYGLEELCSTRSSVSNSKRFIISISGILVALLGYPYHHSGPLDVC